MCSFMQLAVLILKPISYSDIVNQLLIKLNNCVSVHLQWQEKIDKILCMTALCTLIWAESRFHSPEFLTKSSLRAIKHLPKWFVFIFTFQTNAYWHLKNTFSLSVFIAYVPFSLLAACQHVCIFMFFTNMMFSMYLLCCTWMKQTLSCLTHCMLDLLAWNQVGR